MIVAVAGAAAMAETVMAGDEMVLHNLIPGGKSPTVKAVSYIKTRLSAGGLLV